MGFWLGEQQWEEKVDGGNVTLLAAVSCMMNSAILQAQAYLTTVVQGP